MRGNARVWGRMMLTAAVAASCQTADPLGFDRSADVADAQDAGPRPASTSLVLREVFPTGPSGLTPASTEIDDLCHPFPGGEDALDRPRR